MVATLPNQFRFGVPLPFRRSPLAFREYVRDELGRFAPVYNSGETDAAYDAAAAGESVVIDDAIAGRDGEPGSSKENPIRTESADEALQAMAEGKHVEMSRETFSMSLEKLAEQARLAEEMGEDAPDVNMCLASVPNTSIFCGDNLGIPRKQMPQLKSTPDGLRPGSKAEAKLAEMRKAGAAADLSSGKIEVDGTSEYIRWLQDEHGISVDRGANGEGTLHPASKLKATQNELRGDKIGGMMSSARNPESGWAPNQSPIWVSKDGYVLDGHHRWAATVGLDYTDGSGIEGDVDMPVFFVDSPISELVGLTNDFANDFGFEPQEGV